MLPSFHLLCAFTIDRKIFYHPLSGIYSEKKFSDICNATKSSSTNYKEQKIWKDMYVEKYKSLLINLNKGGILTFDVMNQAIMTGNTNIIEEETDTKIFFSIWKESIYELKTNDNVIHFTTSESYESALKSFRKITGLDSIKGFNISAAENQDYLVVEQITDLYRESSK